MVGETPLFEKRGVAFYGIVYTLKLMWLPERQSFEAGKEKIDQDSEIISPTLSLPDN
jgi:hypothetical protein